MIWEISLTTQRHLNCHKWCFENNRTAGQSRHFLYEKNDLWVTRSKFPQPSIKKTCSHHYNIAGPSGYRGWGGRLWNSFSQRVCRGFILHQRVSKCHSHILPALSQPSAILPLLQSMSVLTFTKLASVRLNSCNKSFKSGMNSGTPPSCTWMREEIKTCLEWLCVRQAQICSSSASCCGPETIEWEDFVSVRLHQLDSNETARGVQVQAGQWTDIEVLIRPGSQESLTWRLFVGLYCWSTVIAFPSVSHMGGQQPPHPSPLSLSLILKVSVELTPSSSAGWWDRRYSHCSWCSNMDRGLRGEHVRDRFDWQGDLVILLEDGRKEGGQFKNPNSFIFPAYICKSFWGFLAEMTAGRKGRMRGCNMNFQHSRLVCMAWCCNCVITDTKTFLKIVKNVKT